MNLIKLKKADEKTKALNNFPEKPIGFFQAFKIKSLRVNILLYLLIWNLNSILYAGCGISLSSFSGQLNITMFFLGAVQTTCSYISGNLILEFKEEILLKITTSCMAIFFVIFFFEPKNKLNVESYASFIFTVLMVLGNIGLELNWPILVNFLQRHVPIEFQQNVFSLGSTRLITFLVPYYIEFMVSLSISPIFGFGILAFFARVFLSYATKPEFSESNFSFLTDKLIESSDFKRMELIEIEKKGNATKDYNLINNSV